MSFRLLTELYSLLCSIYWDYKRNCPFLWFPSPHGVIFSLIEIVKTKKVMSVLVSVSSRSYILSYLELTMILLRMKHIQFPSPLGVIFSLISFGCYCTRCWNIRLCFRLLSELYSLLYNDSYDYYESLTAFPSPLGVIFSLINLLFPEPVGPTMAFPSPLGVIFSLILICVSPSTTSAGSVFPSPLGVIFSLIKLSFHRY